MSRTSRTVLAASVAIALTFVVLGALDAPEWILVAALVGALSCLVLIGIRAHTGTEPTLTREEAARRLGVSTTKVDFLVGDHVLKLQREPGGEAWGVTAESVERECRYRETAGAPRRALRLLRRIFWWMP